MQALAAGVARPSTTPLPTFELGSRQQHDAAATRTEAASLSASDSSSSQDEAPRAGPGQEQHSPAGVDTSNLPIVTPSRIRIDSKVLACHTTSQWLTNAIFAALILLKVRCQSNPMHAPCAANRTVMPREGALALRFRADQQV